MRPALRRITVAALAAVMLAPVAAWAQPTRVPLETPAGLRLHNVSATPATLQDKKGLRVELSEETRAKLKAMTPEEQQRFAQQGLAEQLAVIEASDFGDGVIEAEIAGAPRADAGEGARGFVGIAFRLQDDLKTYDAFYLRPTNGRADDQVRRNHSAQYIAHPDWPWFRLRKETPGEVRGVRRPRPRRMDEDPDRGQRRHGQAVRARPGAADADRQRREERRRAAGGRSRCGSTAARSRTSATWR